MRIAVRGCQCNSSSLNASCDVINFGRVGDVVTLTDSIIAVIDDDEYVLDSLKNLLESHGYRVLPYSSAAAFLADEVIFDIDCLISDVSMPIMGGVELQLLVGKERPSLPVILITARPDVNVSNITSFNNRGFFQKPFDMSDLLQAVESAIRPVP